MNRLSINLQTVLSGTPPSLLLIQQACREGNALMTEERKNTECTGGFLAFYFAFFCLGEVKESFLRGLLGGKIFKSCTWLSDWNIHAKLQLREPLQVHFTLPHAALLQTIYMPVETVDIYILWVIRYQVMNNPSIRKLGDLHCLIFTTGECI